MGEKERKPTRRSTIRLQQQKLEEDLAKAKEKEKDKVGEIHGSYLNNASDLLLSFSSNELAKRDITEERRKSVTPTTHLQKLAETNSAAKASLSSTIQKAETAGVEIERKDVSLGSPIIDPRGLIREESGLVLGATEEVDKGENEKSSKTTITFSNNLDDHDDEGDNNEETRLPEAVEA
ncbi:hypothetical protein TrVE_jg10725 [Triparma verrucosa]|uniref:Uncharacterized protein n=1 Tax=Triparma verrucosa TaxID=1606542 RepID=A0A9W7F402_9STRA|nr:hypothetical protein TrVE_jg10725 [Triparma verrucosa]